MSGCGDGDGNCTIDIRCCSDDKGDTDPESPFNGKSYFMGIILLVMGNNEFSGIIAGSLWGRELVHSITRHGKAKAEIF